MQKEAAAETLHRRGCQTAGPTVGHPDLPELAVDHYAECYFAIKLGVGEADRSRMHHLLTIISKYAPISSGI